MGPTLFSTFINYFVHALPRSSDLVDNGPSKTKVTAPFFVDDTTLIVVAPMEQLLMSALNAAMSKICT